MGFREDINGLRALAVVCVVLYHYGVPGFSGGFVGVDVFFVISGFLMAHAVLSKLERGTFTMLGFFAARARRIVPALAVLCLCLLSYGYMRLLPGELARLSESSAAALTFLSNVLFWQQQGYFDAPSQQKLLLHTWSLSVEWQFYLLFPVLAMVLSRVASGRYLVLGFIVSALVSLGLCVALTPLKPEASFFLFPTRAWEMLVGSLLYLARQRPRFSLGAPLGVLVICVVTFTYDDSIPFPGYHAVLPVLGAAALVAARSTSRLLINPVSQFLGNVSYSLYLWHWPVLLCYRKELGEPSALSLLGLCAASLVLSVLSYRYVEGPLRSAGRQLTSGNALLTQLAGAWGVAALSVLLWNADGAPGRLPPLARSNDLATRDDGNPRACIVHDHLCALGEPSAAKVMVWGDSHAEHLYPVLKTLAGEGTPASSQILLGVAHGCPPVRGIELAGRSGGCAQVAQTLYERASQPDVTRVLLSSIWLPYFRADPEDPNSPPGVCRMGAAGCEPFEDTAEALRFVEEQLESDLTELTRAGKHVFLLGPIPLQRTGVAAALARAAWLGTEVPLPRGEAEHMKVQEVMLSTLSRIAERSGATLLDPLPAFCSEGTCGYAESGVSIYRDNNHLTTVGAERLRPLLSLAFRERDSRVTTSFEPPSR